MLSLLVTALPQNLLLLVCQVVKKVKSEREKLQSCHNIGDQLQGGLDV